MQFDVNVLTASVRTLWTAFIAWLPRLFASLFVLVLAVLFARGMRWVARRALRGHPKRHNLQVAVGRISFAAFLALGVLVAATVAFPTFTIGSLIQLLGVSGVVIGFAFKDIFQNFLAGILLLLTSAFDVGDEIVVDSYEGKIEDIQARATIMTTYDRQQVIIPNADLFTKSVTVNTAYERRRMRFDIDVKGSDDPQHVQDVLAGAITSGIEGVDLDPVATVLLLKISSNALTFRLLWWSGSERASYLIVQDRVLKVVHRALVAEGLAFA
jgi:small-conductance mechanosensitive channel